MGKIIALLEGLKRDQGKTVIITTHDERIVHLIRRRQNIRLIHSMLRQNPNFGHGQEMTIVEYWGSSWTYANSYAFLSIS